MKIDFDTGKVIYNDESDELKESLEEMKIKENVGIETGVEKEAVFQKTRHRGLPYGRLKYMFYCLLLMVDGFIGIISIGQTQSIIAQKYLLSDWILGEGEEHEHR
tara:strand:+ start:180 stop:494 length:315 start_codon:yes stop_codon:yes gene_type:complete